MLLLGLLKCGMRISALVLVLSCLERAFFGLKGPQAKIWSSDPVLAWGPWSWPIIPLRPEMNPIMSDLDPFSHYMCSFRAKNEPGVDPPQSQIPIWDFLLKWIKNGSRKYSQNKKWLRFWKKRTCVDEQWSLNYQRSPTFYAVEFRPL